MTREEKRREEDKTRDATASPGGADISNRESCLPAKQLLSVTPVAERQVLACPAERIVAAYHEAMPDNPRVKVLNDARRRTISARWREAAKLTCRPFGYSSVEQGIAAWKSFFEICADSDFLTGRTKAQPGRPPFLADIDFLTSPDGFAKILENKYHREAVPA